MEFTISKMNTSMPAYKNDGTIEYLTGYSFIDKFGHCFIIVYGESKRDYLKNKLTGDSENL